MLTIVQSQAWKQFVVYSVTRTSFDYAQSDYMKY